MKRYSIYYKIFHFSKFLTMCFVKYFPQFSFHYFISPVLNEKQRQHTRAAFLTDNNYRYYLIIMRRVWPWTHEKSANLFVVTQRCNIDGDDATTQCTPALLCIGLPVPDYDSRVSPWHGPIGIDGLLMIPHSYALICLDNEYRIRMICFN